IICYENGILNGIKQVFDTTGNLLEEANYVSGKLEGKFFQKTADQRDVISYYQRNLKNGPHIVYYSPNAKGEKVKAVEANFINDQIEGIVTEYSEKGLKT